MKDLTPKEIEAELDNIHSSSASAFATLYNWVNEFKRNHIFTCNAPHSGHPIEAMPEIDKVHDIVLIDRQVKVSEFIEAIGISHGTDFNFARTIAYEKAISKIPRLHCEP